MTMCSAFEWGQVALLPPRVGGGGAMLFRTHQCNIHRVALEPEDQQAPQPEEMLHCARLWSYLVVLVGCTCWKSAAGGVLPRWARQRASRGPSCAFNACFQNSL